jgi:hypothetical protein
MSGPVKIAHIAVDRAPTIMDAGPLFQTGLIKYATTQTPISLIDSHPPI